MIYNYDFFISYAHKDNEDGFVDYFVERLENNSGFVDIFGAKPRVFFGEKTIRGMDDWERMIRTGIETSRFLIVLLSPYYFQNEMCAREFEWWLEREKRYCILSEGVMPIRIADVPGLYSGMFDMPRELKNRFPRWIRELLSHQGCDLRERSTVRIDNALAALCHAIRNKVWRQDSALKSQQNYSYPNSNKNFVGRLEELRSLHINLEEHHHVALYGLGGVGKTELALMYGRAFAWDYQLGRVFINCENQTSLFNLILASELDLINDVKFKKDDENPLATLFNALDKRRKVICEENEKKGRPVTLGAQLLLILDNVNKIEILNERDLAKLPDYVHVVTTTQENPANFAHLHGRMSVDSLSDSEALELLRILRPFDDDDERQAAKEIIKLFGGHAFRVEKIGAYLRQNKWETYQDFLKKTQERLEHLREVIDATDFQLRHATIRDEECLRPTLKKLTRKAMKLLDWAALFGPDSVVVPWLGELAKIDGDALRESLQELEDYRLLIPVETDSKEQTTGLFNAKLARLHRIAREVVRDEMDTKTRLSMFVQIGEKIDELLTKDDWQGDDVLLDRGSIADFCYDHYLELKNQGPSEYDPHLIRRLNDLCQFRLRDRALEIGQASIVLGQRWVDAEPDNPEALKALGVSFAHSGNSLGWEDSKQAREYYEKAVEIWKKALEREPDDYSTLRKLSYSYKRLGDLANWRNDYEQAREYHEKKLEIWKKALERKPDDSDVLDSLSSSYESLGDLAKSADNYEQAREHYGKRLEIWKKALERTPDNPDALRRLSDSYKSLGDLAKSADNYEQARAYYKKMLEIWKKALERTPDDLQASHALSASYNNLGSLSNAEGDRKQAREYYEQELGIRKQLVSCTPDDLEALYALCVSFDNIGSLLNAEGDYKQAQEYYKQALKIRYKITERTPEDLGMLRDLSASYDRLGALSATEGDRKQAREYYENALKVRDKIAKRTSYDVQSLCAMDISHIKLGDLSIAERDLAQAREHFEEALGISLRIVTLVPNDLNALRTLSNSYVKLGDLSTAEDDYDQAREYYQKALEIQKEIDERTGARTVDTIRALHTKNDSYVKLRDLLEAEGDSDQAREYDVKARETQKEIDARIADILQSLRDRSHSQVNLGDLLESESVRLQAREHHEKLLEIFE